MGGVFHSSVQWVANALTGPVRLSYVNAIVTSDIYPNCIWCLLTTCSLLKSAHGCMLTSISSGRCDLPGLELTYIAEDQYMLKLLVNRGCRKLSLVENVDVTLSTRLRDASKKL